MKVGVVGASGYVGGEVVRLLLSHPEAEISMITSCLLYTSDAADE